MPRVRTAVEMGLGAAQASASPTPTQNLATNSDMFGAAEGRAASQAGQALGRASDRIGEATLRIQSREDAVAQARDYGAYDEAAAGELRRLQTEDDMSKTATVSAYATFLKKKTDEILLSHGGSESSKAVLAAKMEARRSQMVGMAAGLAYEQQKKLVAGEFDKRLGAITAEAQNNPTSINDMFAALDQEINEIAPALTPDEEVAYRARGRDELVKTTVESFVARGAWKQAKELLDETPGAKEMLTPAAQRSINTQIAAAERAEVEARNKGTRKIEELTQILGRAPSMAERVRAAGVAEPAGERTLQTKIADTERALGRPLSMDERGRLAGLDPQKAQTDAGKVLQDREMFARQYGEGSPQVAAFDEAATAPSDVKLTEIGGMRKEFTALSKDFVQVRDAYQRIQASAVTKDAAGRTVPNSSAAGDLALIFNYMKLLDPGSTVREGEFANAQNAGGAGSRMIAQYNKVISGERLSDDQRKDFLNRAEDLVRAQSRMQLQLERQFGDIAKRNNMKPEDVTVDFMGELRGMNETPPAGPGGDPGAPSAPAAKPKIVIGLDGKVIGGAQAAEPPKADEAANPAADGGAPKTFAEMELADLTALDIEKLSPGERAQVSARLKELGY